MRKVPKKRRGATCEGNGNFLPPGKKTKEKGRKKAGGVKGEAESEKFCKKGGLSTRPTSPDLPRQISNWPKNRNWGVSQSDGCKTMCASGGGKDPNQEQRKGGKKGVKNFWFGKRKKKRAWLMEKKNQPLGSSKGVGPSLREGGGAGEREVIRGSMGKSDWA